MSSLVLRKCNSEKNCSHCEELIPVGEMYHTGPNKSLCIKCYEEEKRIKGTAEPEKLADNSYVVTGLCEEEGCGFEAIGILWGKKTCAAHIQNRVTSSI